MIPKNLFICVADKNNIDESYKNNVENLLKNNSNYKLNMVDYNDFIEILKNEKIEWLEYFLKLNKNLGAMIGDYMKYVLLYLYGGVYIDIKSNTLKSFDEIIGNNTKPIFYHWKTTKIDEYGNYFLISNKNESVYLEIINGINEKIKNYKKVKNINTPKLNVLKFTGPHYTKNIVDKNKNKIVKSNKERKDDLICSKVQNHTDKCNTPHYSKVYEELVI
tara:strand:+ start:375 stop:1031 length:657 start_codon:yes stop_codon:yes gene_type:complete